jgi:hypothetical protein
MYRNNYAALQAERRLLDSRKNSKYVDVDDGDIGMFILICVYISTCTYSNMIAICEHKYIYLYTWYIYFYSYTYTYQFISIYKLGFNTEPLLSSIQILPETEALLRTIFRTLDVNDSGYVSVLLLLQCLGGMICSALLCVYTYVYI